ncbi:hypothetical protein LACDD01_00016 [Lactococcus sp. DD01]|nr:hypothetical protein LACDD01_00016 [Lactococcus sp. DD01]
MRATVEELTLATDCKITPEQANKLRVIKAHFDALTFCKGNLDQLITELGKEFQEEQKLVQAVPDFKNPITTCVSSSTL